MRQRLRFLILSFLCFCWPIICDVSEAFPSAAKIQDTTVHSAAMTLGSGAPYGYAINGLSFQQEALWTYNGWQYIAYYNSSRRVCLSRRQLPSGTWETITFTDYTLSTTTDAHNVAAVGVCPNDGTIHLAYDHHDSTLHYRVSQAGVATNPASVTWSTSLFGSTINTLSGLSHTALTDVTYPQFWATPSGDLQFGFRYQSSGNGDWYMADYTASTASWSNIRQIVNRAGTYSDRGITSTSSSRCPYLNNVGYGPDGKLHWTWTWRETATGTANHDIMYAYSTDGGYTWYNNNIPASLSLGTASNPVQNILHFSWLNEGPVVIGSYSPQVLITLSSPDVTAVTLDSYYGIMNQQAQAIDSQGRVHVVMFHCTEETYASYPRTTIWGSVGARRYFHYWRGGDGVWTRNELLFVSGDVNSYVGSRPKVFIRENGDAFVIYQSWQSVSPTSTSIYITSGNLVIQAATAAGNWNDWQIIHTETGPFINEMLGDPYRFNDGVLSVMVQQTPSTTGGSSVLRVLDFQLN